ncbi:MAG: asparagine synthase (glutamine-hydrolyzing), partial [Solirubrobacterales bacterium]
MCGIGGCVVRPGVEPDLSALDRVAAALDHRGPDDAGIQIERNAALVNARLAIVDTSEAGHQPMSDRSGRWTLTYNGEIFNHLKLRRELPPIAFRGTSDTETLLHALDRWGPAGAASRTSGFFAFAALDAVERRLFLVRDRFGVKPLYMANLGDAIWFASEIRTLLAAGIPARPRLPILSHAVRVGGVGGARPRSRESTRVLPGSVVAIDLQTLESSERKWWEPADEVDPELSRQLAAVPREELTDRLEAALRGGVRRRLMADVPVGTMCSGGIDSSLVTAFAHDERPSVTAFNASLPDEGRADERRWAETVARSVGVELETVTITSSRWREALVDAVRHHEYPLVGGSVPISLIAEAARERGIKVLLTGEAADELFGGYVGFHLRE